MTSRSRPSGHKSPTCSRLLVLVSQSGKTTWLTGMVRTLRGALAENGLSRTHVINDGTVQAIQDTIVKNEGSAFAYIDEVQSMLKPMFGPAGKEPAGGSFLTTTSSAAMIGKVYTGQFRVSVGTV